jgi:hypothetical protein
MKQIVRDRARLRPGDKREGEPRGKEAHGHRCNHSQRIQCFTLLPHHELPRQTAPSEDVEHAAQGSGRVGRYTLNARAPSRSLSAAG